MASSQRPEGVVRSSSWDTICNLAQSFSTVMREEIPMAKELIQLYGGKYSVDFYDKKLLLLLVVCSENCYTLDNEMLERYGLNLINKQTENNTGENILQFGVYEVTSGKFKGKHIMAFRGTKTVTGVAQDISYALSFKPPYGGTLIKTTIKVAIERTKQHKPDFICGHSLGGLISECVASELRIPGASFNSPGPYSSNKESNLIGDNFNGLKYEIHLTAGDPVSYVGNLYGPNFSHIGQPKWHDGPQGKNPIVCHSITEMRKAFEKT